MDYSLTWEEAAAVVVSAAGMYLALLLLLRLAGRRIVAALGAHDVAAGIGLGAIFGRTVLGYTPSLPAGLIGIATLLGLHCGTRLLVGNPRLDRVLGSGPVLVMKDGQVLPDALRQSKLSEDDLRAALRRASIGSYADVGVAVVERTGTISVLRTGQATADVLTGVDGWR
ncbi:DUF421 domain-containing protein [Sporichthya sp.]|uniref:DUF421 domain-containing protein n=1 Tax=Sporichthya sp. TaxID=65475 RepID=UPI00178E4EE4|nr:YetF domain-containing protein [Sporichthya sp.]MBA3743066.1 DUF421 domain-containing protein [Sporichthya sp.]